ncbi:MAG TPA: VOC family protein [Patescibacteria group bacterium]|nr:VOC family protein [Patescibacteria group bacterium]
MAKVIGIGAIIMYAREARSLAAWYSEVLGIEMSYNEGENHYYGEIGSGERTAQFGIYAAQDDFQTGGRAMMINYQVDDFDTFLKDLQEKGIVVEKKLDLVYGKFAYINDPEGNPIELWQEAPPTAQSAF